MLLITPATPDDARAVAEVHISAWRAAYRGVFPDDYLAAQSLAEREAWWAEVIAGGKTAVLLAKSADTLYGWLSFGTCRDTDASSSQAELWAMYVAPDAWSRGIGRALWQHARQAMQAKGFTHCSLWVLAHNARAIRFYTAAGFLPDACPPKFIERAGLCFEARRYLCALAA